jgi:hypothetical protein
LKRYLSLLGKWGGSGREGAEVEREVFCLCFRVN